MIARLALTLLALTSPAWGLSCMWESPEERAERFTALQLSSSETETLASGIFRFVEVLDRTKDHGDESITALWTFTGVRYLGGQPREVSFLVEASFWCWQRDCSREEVRPAALTATLRLSRETPQDRWQVYLGECTQDRF